VQRVYVSEGMRLFKRNKKHKKGERFLTCLSERTEISLVESAREKNGSESGPVIQAVRDKRTKRIEIVAYDFRYPTFSEEEASFDSSWRERQSRSSHWVNCCSQVIYQAHYRCHHLCSESSKGHHSVRKSGIHLWRRIKRSSEIRIFSRREQPNFLVESKDNLKF
jgi:hypothetical protein